MIKIWIRRLEWCKAVLAISAIAAIGSVTSSLAAADAEPSPQEKEGIIFVRQQTMTQLNRDGELLGRIVAGMAPPGSAAYAIVGAASAQKAAKSREKPRMRPPLP